jgi:uncharacterized membrane protein
MGPALPEPRVVRRRVVAMIEDPVTIVAVLMGVVFLSVRLTERFAWAARFSTVLWVLSLAALASNTGLIPTDAPLYGGLVGFAVPFAVSLVLMKVSLADVRSAGLAMTVAFVVASLGTVVGVVVASLALEPWLASILGDASWKIAGPYTGTYIGGSLNFFALWSGLEIGNPDLFAAANAVDNLSIFLLFGIWVLAAGLWRSRFPVADRWRLRPGAEPAAEPSTDAPPRLVVSHVVTLVFAAVAVMALSEWVKTRLVDPVLPGVPAILLVTTFALLLGQLPAIRRLEGAWEIGNLAFYVFFAAVGAMIHVLNAIRLAPVLFAYVAIIVAGHMVVVYGVGRLLRLDLGVLTIASAAAKTGPPMVIPLAEQLGWKHLALPGVLMGLLGYAVGNYVGFAVAYLVRALL